MASERGGVSGRVTGRIALGLGLVTLLFGGIAMSQTENRRHDPDLPEAEFHLARVIFGNGLRANSRGFNRPMWAIDYPMAEIHFLPALNRLTGISVAEDSRHLELTDERIFDYPFLFLQQPGQGYWDPSEEEAAALREYLERGGFLLVDDFHGNRDYDIFVRAISRVFPDREVMEIPGNDPLMSIFFDLDDRVQIPGERHLSRGGGPPRMLGPPYWLGIYDDSGERLMVGINFNIDMGDGWEHADDAHYPAEMTGMAYRLGVNYVIYAMTH